jgi:ATP-binding cassette subfamily B protein
MYKFIFELAGDRLVFFISHRLGFAKNADRIIVVNDGIIAEDGTHKDLMVNAKGMYSVMYEAQRAWYV